MATPTVQLQYSNQTTLYHSILHSTKLRKSNPNDLTLHEISKIIVEKSYKSQTTEMDAYFISHTLASRNEYLT
jgi:hypothetical protein